MSSLPPDIEELHTAACEGKQDGYIDPQNGLFVFTAYAHRKRGRCCGSMCRHCPYDWINVKKEQPASDTDSDTDTDEEEEGAEPEEEEVGEPQEDFSMKRVVTSKAPPTDDSESSGSLANTGKSPVYTRTGDSGKSSLFNGERRRKDDLLFAALGDVDELCSFVGAARVLCNASTPSKTKKGDWVIKLGQELEEIQSQLMDLGSHIATPRGSDVTTQTQLDRTKFPR